MTKHQERFDIAIVGAGASGIMAAIWAKKVNREARVVLLEKNKELGKKILITGKGRCNITQAEFETQEFVSKIGKNGKFLYSSLTNFGPLQTIDFFHKLGLKTKIERGGRVFPISDDANEVIQVLRRELENLGVTIMFRETVKSINIKKSAGQLNIESLELSNKIIFAQNFIIATGGKSYPSTGSTGDGFNWSKKIGHQVNSPTPALVPIEIAENWIDDLKGLSLRNIKLTAFADGKKKLERFGEMIFTHFGVSGPIILDASAEIGKLLKKSLVTLQIDLKPALDYPKLDTRLQRDFSENRNKNFKNYLPDLIPKKLIELFIKLSGVEPSKKLHFINREERKKILHLLKEFTIKPTRLLDFEWAIITAGGVDLKQVESSTMKSKIIPNLYFAGELLDLAGPTGGYNLQIAWSTGATAGVASAKELKK